MNEKQLVKKLQSIRDGIEGDNFTWENITSLIDDIEDIASETDLTKRLLAIRGGIEGDNFTWENITSLIDKIRKNGFAQDPKFEQPRFKV